MDSILQAANRIMEKVVQPNGYKTLLNNIAQSRSSLASMSPLFCFAAEGFPLLFLYSYLIYNEDKA